MKRGIKRVLSVLTAVALLLSLAVPAWAAGNRMKCYTIATSNCTVYSDSSLRYYYGAIYPSDEVEVLSIAASYCKVKYPTRNGTKIGYIPRSAILLNTSGKNYQARERITTYRRDSTSYSYGSIYVNDTVLVLGTRGSFTQVRYPVSYGYKFAFIKTSDAERALYDNLTPVTVSEGVYTIRSAMNNNYVMDVDGNRSADGTNIQLWQSNNTDAQKFKIVSAGGGWYKILNAASGKSLDVYAATNRNKQNVILYYSHGGDNQKWRFLNAGNGYCYIQSKLGYYLDAEGARTANGTNIMIFELNKGSNQKWKLSPEGSSDVKKQVQTRLDQIANGTLTLNSSTVLAVGKKFVGTRSNEQCKGYAKNLFYLCFGVLASSTQPKPNNHLLYSNSGMTLVGSVTSMNNSSISALFQKARPGDFVQMQRTHTGSHSAIVYSVSGSGVTFQEANTDGKNGIKRQYYSWSTLCSKNAKMSVYTAKNYNLR